MVSREEIVDRAATLVEIGTHGRKEARSRHARGELGDKRMILYGRDWETRGLLAD